MEENCLFCRIIKGEIPSSKVYEDEEVLVIQKKHITSLATMEDGDEKIISKIYKVINEIAEKQGFKEKGYRVIVNCGEDGGQEVGHLHFHLLAGKKLGEKIV